MSPGNNLPLFFLSTYIARAIGLGTFDGFYVSSKGWRNGQRRAQNGFGEGNEMSGIVNSHFPYQLLLLFLM